MNIKGILLLKELGMPKFDKNGKRTWYSRNEGLSRLYLGRVLDLNSGYGDLAYSNDIGKVVMRIDKNLKRI